VASCWAEYGRPTAMATERFHRTEPPIGSQSQSQGLTQDIAEIQGEFTGYLRARHYAAVTIERYRRYLVRIAGWVRQHQYRAPLAELTRRMVPGLLARVLPGRCPVTRMGYRKAVFHWLRFKGHYSEPVVRPWMSWVHDYLQFLQTHRGVGEATLALSAAHAKAFLEWQFGTGRAKWLRVRPSDIWSFAHHWVRGVKPATGRWRLGYVRRFLSFVHLQGACGPELAAAIPKVAVNGGPCRPEILTSQQRRQLSAAFERTTPEGKRDYAMTLCLLDLGLRAGEVIGLRVQDIDWQARQLQVRLTKTGQRRQLPLPAHVWRALRDYHATARPQNAASDHLFLRHPQRQGYPLSRDALKAMVRRAYRRCGFPSTWSGTHRLRHTFASRLHQRGVDLKSIADLLGHRRLDSTNLYTQVAVEALRALALPWPWRK